MHADQLIRMANQIGSFFEAMPDRPEALHNTAQHIRNFWEPRMRRALLAHVDLQTGVRTEPQAESPAAVQTAAQSDPHAEPHADLHADRHATAPIDAPGIETLSDFVAEALALHRAELA